MFLIICRCAGPAFNAYAGYLCLQEGKPLGFVVNPLGNAEGKVIKDAGAKGFNPGLIVLLVVGGLLLTFLIGNYVLYMYAQKNLPPRKKKPVSKKKMKKEKLKQGISAPGE
ncbi:hypothetical protein JRO89_XSUnG0143700 [Xanthoceras sorbifolium]|uniref:DNA-binding protein S1FA n=1 Tax=Xanthoceras sorbifolium TaxID=99658 RepID=A0ABQ8GZB9_9ROSI|nr:hypothetical protein JRO89_XSUnG0143700 [Xanthoceras sorbifolium]